MKIAASLLPLPFALLLALPVAAQEVAPPWAPKVRGGAGSPFDSLVQATVDGESGALTHVRRFDAAQVALGSAPCFDNSQRTLDLPDGQYIVSNTGEEMVCWGVKNCRGASRLKRLTIAYGTEALDRSVGGPGASFSLALYRGTTGFGVVGTEIFRRTFVGLPASLSSLNTYVTLQIDFTSAPIPLADVPFGWGFLQIDGDTGPVSVLAPRRLLGTVNAMDIYGPGPANPATYVGTFNYAPTCGAGAVCANMFVQLDEIAVSELASTTVLNGSGTNPVLFHELFPARLGSTWAGWVDARIPGSTRAPYTLLFTSLRSRTPLAGPYGELLVDLSLRTGPALPGEGGYTYVLPPDAALAGVEIFMQAVVLPPASPTIRLTNALAVRIGY